jgi:hypothetical protein
LRRDPRREEIIVTPCRRSAALFALVLLIASAAACQGTPQAPAADAAATAAAAREAENARNERERATKLAEALKPLQAAASKANASDADLATLLKSAPSRFHADIKQIEGCRIDEAINGAVAQQYMTVPVPAVECFASMQALVQRARTTLLNRVLDNAPSSPREDAIESSIIDLARSNSVMATTLITMMIDYGPPDVRLATFEAVAGRLSAPDSADGDALKALLQRSYAGEHMTDQKEKMASRMKGLGVPLEAAPTPAPAPPS